MPKTRIWLDCDPGLDDAAALLMALGAPDALVLEGVSTVAGNVGLEPVTQNAQGLLALAGRDDIPVHAGCPRPMLTAPVDAEHVHGEGGIGGVSLPTPTVPLSSVHAVEAIDAFCRRGLDGDKGTLVLTGPMTNAALAIIRAPAILEGLDQIVFIGGVALGSGNITPAAEFNFFSDPHAARVVLTSGIKCVMMGLDVTRHAAVTMDRIDALRRQGGACAETLAQILNIYRGQVDKAVLHDPCTIAYLLEPDLFRGKACAVDVDCESTLSLGRSIADWRRITDKPANVTVMTELEADGFFALLNRTVGKL